MISNQVLKNLSKNKLVGNNLLNVLNNFYVVVLQLPCPKYIKPFHILYISRTHDMLLSMLRLLI